MSWLEGMPPQMAHPSWWSLAAAAAWGRQTAAGVAAGAIWDADGGVMAGRN